jgi:RND family efflux transporter MFP subunit
MKRYLILAAVLAATAAAIVACSRGHTQNAGPALRTVRVAAVQSVPLDGSFHAMGFLTPKDEMRMSFKVSGVIESIKVDEGQSVKAGQLLASLKQSEIDASLEQARESATKAQRDLQRGKALLADGVTTEESVQDLTTAYSMALASQKSVQFNAAHAKISAAANGVVLRKMAEANEVVQAGQTVLVLGGATRGWVVRIGLADRDVVRLHLKDTARVEFDAWPEQVFSGTVSNIASAADSATGTFTVEIQVEPGAARFAQGLVAKVSLGVATGGRQVLVVPVQSLLEANDREAGVFVLDESGVVHRTTLQIGPIMNGNVQVRSGLAAGAKVVIDGAAFLENGESVRVASL